ncbi:MAG: arsenic metallochaperone ArsD family protein [Eubacteriaceae bacterium]|nr:arsenic metallochaperone ArsD family protein [Eubacteriaceae bacterium]
MCTIAIYNPIGCDNNSPDVLKIKVAVNALKQRGITIKLVDFENSPDQFCDDQKVEEVLLQDGPDVFPITVVDGEVYQKNSYPHYGDLLAWSANAPL